MKRTVEQRHEEIAARARMPLTLGDERRAA